MKIKFIVNIILLNINLFTEESYLNNNSSINIDTSNENIKSEESNTETLYTSTFSNENKLIDGDSENVSSSQNNLNIIELSNINNDNNKNNVNTIPTISHTVNNLSNPNYSHPYKKNNITSKYIIKKKEINDNFLIQEYVQNNFYNPVFIEDKSQLNHDIKWLEINKKTHLLDKYKKRISSLVFWYFIAFNFYFLQVLVCN